MLNMTPDTTTDENSVDIIADDDMFESTEDHYEIDDGFYDDDDDDEYCEDCGIIGSKRRQRQQYKEQKESVEPVAIEEEHPMRTDEWLVKVNMSPFLKWIEREKWNYSRVAMAVALLDHLNIHLWS